MASQIIQTLITELTADGAQMREEINRNARELQAWGARVGAMSKKIGVGVGVAGVGAAAGLSVMVKSSIDGADALNDLSQAVGVGVESLSELRYASDLNGTNFEALSGGFKKLNNSIADAAKGTGAQADAFDALGISVKNTDGSLRSADDVFMDLAGSFSSFEDGATKSSLAVDIFGKSGADLIPMLNAGREGIKAARDEARRFGLVVTTETAKAADDFNDSLEKMDKALSGFSNRIAQEVTPTLAEFVDTINDPATQDGLASIASGIISIGAASVKALAETANFTKWLGEEFATRASGIALDDIPRLEGLLVDLEAVKSKGMVNRFFTAANYMDDEKLKQAIEITKAQIAAARKWEAALTASQPDSKPTDDQWAADAMAADEADKIQRKLATQKERADGLKTLQEEQKKLNELVVKESEAMMERLALGNDATELEKMQYRAKSGDLQNANSEQKIKLEGLASELDLQKQMLDLGEWAKEQYREKASLEDALMTDVERTNKLWDDRINKIKTLGYDEAKAAELIAKAEAGRKKDLDEKGKKGVDDLSEYSKQAARNMQSAFADFLFDPFEDGLEGLLKSFAQTMQRMAAEWAAAQIFNGIGDWGDSKKGAGGFLGGLGSILGGMFAEGGRPPLGKISVVGDGGEPELFVPDTAGTIIPFSKLAGGGGASISIGHMSFPGVNNAREAEMAAGAAARKMLGIMSSAQRYS